MAQIRVRMQWGCQLKRLRTGASCEILQPVLPISLVHAMRVSTHAYVCACMLCLHFAGRVLVANLCFGPVACALASFKYAIFAVLDVKNGEPRLSQEAVADCCVGEIKGKTTKARADRRKQRSSKQMKSRLCASTRWPRAACTFLQQGTNRRFRCC
eukprot:6206842-Pleurochrysis_carterae.AAC.6